MDSDHLGGEARDGGLPRLGDLVPELVRERPVALVRILHKRVVQAPQILRRPKRPVAEQRSVRDEAALTKEFRGGVNGRRVVFGVDGHGEVVSSVRALMDLGCMEARARVDRVAYL